ncbi:MAG: hypothetical protein A2Y25_10695 [Candidatus Melainabacteria bacterium GWF2_37_15]|nr:MAG: hypothetical protein A2Y25_10695 [Candidatus Melainabacteria bacterium GWF2_37_15]
MPDKSKIPELPTIDEISETLPAVSEYCPASRLPELFKESQSDTLPVIDMEGKLTGIISEYDLAKIIPDWSMDQESYLHEYLVASLMTRDVWAETTNTNISELLSNVNKMHTRVVPIVEKDETYTGSVITRSSIIHYLTKLVKPRSLGGLATPLGVYITDGKHQAGPGNLGLFLTGVVLGLIISVIEVITAFVINWFNIDSIGGPYFPLIILGQIVLFLLILRFTPLVKMHAAEHQTINAIEKGMPLSLETVKMQPKEHVRCGTNLMVLILGIQIIVIIYGSFLTQFGPLFQFLFLILGFSFIFSYWKRGGMLLQKYFTTVKASDKYIKSGIKAGNEILKKYKEDTDPRSSSIFTKIWNSGLIQIVAGFILVNFIFDIIV